jgi:DNA-binding response OmpR family regulator
MIMAKRILIADDEPTIVAFAQRKLEQHGYIVETARNGKEAMSVIDIMDIDLVVLDVVMPEMDGVDVYKEMKKSARTAHIPIVIITDSRIFRESFQTLGVEHFLPKPLDADKLIRKVEYIFTCAADSGMKNKQMLILSSDIQLNEKVAGVLEAQSFVVGKSTDPIDFISTCLILSPRIVLVDVILRGDIPSPEVIRSLRCFSRLRDMTILVFTGFTPEAVDSMEGIEQLNTIKGQCVDAGATKYIGRFTPVTLWDKLREFVI